MMPFWFKASALGSGAATYSLASTARVRSITNGTVSAENRSPLDSAGDVTGGATAAAAVSGVTAGGDFTTGAGDVAAGAVLLARCDSCDCSRSSSLVK